MASAALAELFRDALRLLRPVPVVEGGGVLVPVLELRVVLGEHQFDPLGNIRHTSRTWQPYSSADQTAGCGRSAACGRDSAACTVAA